jgi:nitrogen fixation protein FixH
MMRFLPGDGRPFTGFHMLAVVFLFFGTIIGVNLVMATLAVRTFPGLNAHNSYVASQTYNILLEDADAQSERGWRAEIDAADGHVRLALADRSGALLRGLTVKALAGRPASAAEDRTLEFEATAEGYRSAEPLAPGRWLIELEAWRDASLAWRETHQLTVLRGEVAR